MVPVAPATSLPAGTLITVAPTGAEHAKADLPQLPTTLEELVETAQRCEAAGASLIHLHIRDGEHRPTLDAGRLRAAVEAVRSSTDLVVQLSTGGSVHDPLEQRLTVLDAEPDSCSLTCGTTNFGDDVFLNPWGFMSDLYVQAQEREVVPEFELFDLGHVHALQRLIDTHGLPFGGRVHVDFVTGVPGAMPATTGALMAGVAMLPAEVTSWSATGIGRGHLPIMAAALSAGGPPAGGDGGQRRLRPGAGRAAQRRARDAGRRAGHSDAAAADGHRAGARPAGGQGPARSLTLRAAPPPRHPGSWAHVRGLDGLVAAAECPCIIRGYGYRA